MTDRQKGSGGTLWLVLGIAVVIFLVLRFVMPLLTRLIYYLVLAIAALALAAIVVRWMRRSR